MDQTQLQLWIAYPNDLLNDSEATRCEAILDQDDRTHVRRFKFDHHRRESLTTRALVRNALSYRRPVPPRSWRFTTNMYGKPTVDPDCGLRFNVSNSLELVVCLVAESVEIGVDVEPFPRAEVMLELSSEVFSVAERAQLEELPMEMKLDRALSLWTLKEAYVKARGLGLSIPLDKVSFLFEKERAIRLEIDPAINDQSERWRFFLMDHVSHRIAGVVESPMANVLQAMEARPAVAPPIGFNEYEIEWFP